LPEHYRHLTIDDRTEIQRLKDDNVCQAEIARRIGVHPSTISRELKRGSWQPETDHANLRPYLRNKLDTRGPHERLYLAGQAQQRADTRKAHSHQPYRMWCERLLNWVIIHLKKGWSPLKISGRLSYEFPHDPEMRVCPETLYGWVYSPEQAHRELAQYLPRGQHKRRRRKGRRVRSTTIQYRTSISDRPGVIATREEFGHWESDSVLGAGHSGAIHTAVERTSRCFVAVKVPNLTARETLRAQLRVFKALPAHAVKSVTNDNGSEFAFHYRLADTIGVPTYFTDPYAAYQRGTNENRNGQLRRYLPKGTSFEDLTQAELDEYVNAINNEPLRVLGWATPAEVFQELALNPRPTTTCCTSN